MADAGLLKDVVHLTDEGGEWFGTYVYDILFENPACIADLNADCVLDFFDISLFVDAFAGGVLGGPPAGADWDGDGKLDFFDISAFVAAFAGGCS